MSEDIQLTQIARILKSNGTEGELIMSFRDMAPEDIDTQEPVFIYSDGLPVPFFITSFIPKGRSRALVRLVGIDSFDDAEEICGEAVYADADSYADIRAEQEGDFSMLAGWILKDENGRTVGTISDYEDIPGNPCLYVDTENGQAMIPLQEELILSVDDKNRILTMTVPKGLL